MWKNTDCRDKYLEETMGRSLYLALSFIFLAAVYFMNSARADDALDHAIEILRAAPLIDGHNDLPWVIREKLQGDVEGYNIAVRARFETDLPRLREGQVGTQFWSVFVPTALLPFEAMRTQLEQIDIARRLIAKYPGDLGFSSSVADIRREEKSGRIASLIGIEGGHTIGNSLGVLRTYYDLGVRYMTLTHFQSNDWADSATGEARHGGISPFGEEVVREMNRLGMIVDLSHVSVDTMRDVLDVSEAPVIFSHSGVRKITSHVRNVPDSILKLVQSKGGVVMIPFMPPFVSESVRAWADELFPLLAKTSTDADWQRVMRAYVAEHGPSPRAVLADVVDHIEHVRKIAGADHVGIGGDFYGSESEEELVKGLEDVAKYPLLFAELIRRGWSDEDLKKLSRNNLLRVFSEVEAVSFRLRKHRPPSLEKFTQEDQ